VSVGEPYGAGGLRSGVTWERNNRNDLTTATEFFSYSPTRYGAWITAAWAVGSSWRLQPTASYYRSRYADPDRRANELVATRLDHHVDLSLRARRRFGADWQFIAEYTYARNNSNFSEFSFSQNIVLVGVTRPF
jgi:hypothetical protein